MQSYNKYFYTFNINNDYFILFEKLNGVGSVSVHKVQVFREISMEVIMRLPCVDSQIFHIPFFP